jgi:hypothetical protein
MKQTAMQELRNDLVKAKEKSIIALNDINNEILRKTCQESVKLTIESIIERIDDELLEIEKQQIVDSFEKGYENGACISDEDPIYHGGNYYNKTFKS